MKKILLMIISVCSSVCNITAQKNDTVYLMDGSKITGEFKKFDNGILTLKTNGMGTIGVEYDKISTIYSGKHFEITDNSGFSLFGAFARSFEPGKVEIIISNGNISKPIKELVQVAPIKNIFWQKFYGSIDAGASYYKSSDIIQYNFNSNVNFRSKKYFIIFNLGSIYSDQRKSDSSIISKKNDISLDLNRLFKGPWWAGFSLKAQQNTELDLQHRFQVGINAGYNIVFTNPVRLYMTAGVIGNHEKSIDTNAVSSNFEGAVTLNFQWLVYRHPKINISSFIDFYPSITIGGRYRTEFDLSAKYEIFRDFYLGASFYDSYDSKPTSGGEALNDFGTAISIGYSF